MFSRIIKLLIAVLIANSAWRIGSAYASFYRFKDAVAESAQFGADRPVEQLRERVLELAAQYDLPITDNNFTIRRESIHTYVSGSYIKSVEVFPGYRYPWPFSWSVETMYMTGLK